MIPDPATLSSAQGPMAAYQELRKKGLLQPDPAQELAVARLQSLYHALLDYRPESGTAAKNRSINIDLPRPTGPHR